MKYLGIDFGTKKIGIAVSDDDGAFAFPKGIIATAQAMQELTSLCAAENIGHIVIGESIATNEEKNVLADAARVFAEMLSAKTNLPISFEREDFSSVEAHRYQTTAGDRDDSAAAIILQRFLDKVVKKNHE